MQIVKKKVKPVQSGLQEVKSASRVIEIERLRSDARRERFIRRRLSFARAGERLWADITQREDQLSSRQHRVKVYLN